MSIENSLTIPTATDDSDNVGPKLALVGPFQLQLGPRTVPLTKRKCCALLGYLALAPRGSETRERLVGLLWSESEEKLARASLRQCLHEIREALGPHGADYFHTEKHIVTLDPAAVEVDFLEMSAAASAGRVHPGLLQRAQAADALLENFESLDPAFRIWLLAKRQSLQDRLLRDLEAIMRVPERPAELIRDAAAAILNLDPTHEEAARALIRARVAAGDIGGALGTYKRLWDVLDEDFDVEPSKETQTLIAEIKLAQPEENRERGAGSAPMALVGSAVGFVPALPTPPAGTPKVVVAVGAFSVLGEDTGHNFVVPAFRQELIASLVRFREWVVRNAPSGVTAPEKTHGASTEYVVEASALQQNGATRLILTLRNRATDDYLWSERVLISAESWLDTLQQIVQRIASALNVYISSGRLAQIIQRPPQSMNAYDRWLRGQALLLSWSPQFWHEAVETFRSIIAEAPEFAPAYSSLAPLNTSMHFFFPGVLRSREREEEALRFAQEATRLDPVDSRGHLCLGWAHAMMKQYDQGAAHHRLALELNDNDPWTLTSAALGAAFRGEEQAARQLCGHAFEISPTPSPSQWGYRAEVAFMRGDYADCAAAAANATGIVHISGWRVAALSAMGDVKGARLALEQFLSGARAQWFGKSAPTDEEVTRWFLHAFPIRNREDWERLRDSFRRAGAPSIDIDHHSW